MNSSNFVSATVRADADPQGGEDKLDKLLKGLGNLVLRMDAMEAKKDKKADADKDDKKADNGDVDMTADKKADKKADADKDDKKADADKDDKKEDKKADAQATTSKDGVTLDKVLSMLDSLCGRMDAFEKKDDKKADGDDLKKEREENGLKKNDSADDVKADSASELATLRQEMADMRRQLTPVADADRNSYVDAQVRADRVAQAFGESAPRWMNGEDLLMYRRRMANKFKAYSATWKNVDLTNIHADTMGIAEDAIYADALAAATRPATLGEGILREVKTPDGTGRNISKFYGDPEACWGPFKTPGRRVTGHTLKFTH